MRLFWLGSASILSAIVLPIFVVDFVLLVHESVNIVQVSGMDLIFIGLILPSIKAINCDDKQNNMK